MEAVNKVINSASHAIWGDTDVQSQTAQQSHEEPISGVQGKGAANDPYDAGNRDEQPDAPASEANTAPQEPRLDSQPVTGVRQPAASSAFDKPSTTATADTPSTTATADMASTTAAGSSSNTAAAGSSSKATEDTSAGAKDEGKEQRDTDKTESDEKTQKQMDQGRRGTAVIMEDHGVSKEALKGPQGPAPHTADEFEKEGKGGNKDAHTVESKGESGTSSKGSEKSSGSNGKQGAMSKMKEGLKKVAHPRHGKQSSE